MCSGRRKCNQTRFSETYVSRKILQSHITDVQFLFSRSSINSDFWLVCVGIYSQCTHSKVQTIAHHTSFPVFTILPSLFWCSRLLRLVSEGNNPNCYPNSGKKAETVWWITHDTGEELCNVFNFDSVHALTVQKQPQFCYHSDNNQSFMSG